MNEKKIKAIRMPKMLRLIPLLTPVKTNIMVVARKGPRIKEKHIARAI